MVPLLLRGSRGSDRARHRCRHPPGGTLAGAASAPARGCRHRPDPRVADGGRPIFRGTREIFGHLQERDPGASPPPIDTGSTITATHANPMRQPAAGVLQRHRRPRFGRATGNARRTPGRQCPGRAPLRAPARRPPDRAAGLPAAAQPDRADPHRGHPGMRRAGASAAAWPRPSSTMRAPRGLPWCPLCPFIAWYIHRHPSIATSSPPSTDQPPAK